MTAAQVMTAIQQKLNDTSKQYFTDAIVLAAVNTVLGKLSAEYKFLGPVTGTVTMVNGTHTYDMPTVSAVGTIFELSAPPVYDSDTVLQVTDEDWLNRYDPLWTGWDAGTPAFLIMLRDGTKLRLAPKPDSDITNGLSLTGPALHYVITNSSDTPLLRYDIHPLLVYEGAIECISLIGDSQTWAARIPGFKDEATQYRRILNDARNGANRTRLIRGSRGGSSVLSQPAAVVDYPWSIP